MSIYSICFSPTGGTQRAADCLCSAWDADVVSVDLCDRNEDFSTVSLSESDLCFVSVPSYGGRIPVLAARRLHSIQGNRAVAVAVCVYGNRAYDDTLLELKNLLTEQGFRCIAAVAAVAEHSMLRQFAAGRPDAQDAAELNAFACQIGEKLKNSAFSVEFEVPGATPYRPIGAFVQPVAGEECMLCGVCADMCPAGAIPADNPCVTDNQLCAACARCISVCPVGARRLNPDIMAVVEARLAPMLTGRKKNELFL